MTMSFSDRYIEFVKNKTIAEPEKNWNKILLGFQGNALINKLRPPKNLAKGYQKLNDLMLSFIAKALSSGSRYIWGNILAPCEVINSMGIRMISVEAWACFLSGYHLEDFFIDYAQSIGLAPTLCSYHKAFVGAVESGVCPKPKYAVTTSLSCDGNLNTFRFLEKQEQVPFSLLDVPYTNDEDAVEYLADQIREMAHQVENHMGIAFSEDKLRETIRIENETMDEIAKFYQLEQKHYYPGSLTMQLYMMMGTHLLMGTKEFLDVVKFMNKDIQTYPAFTGKRILWVHVMPFYQETLKQYFDCSEKYQVLASDIVIDYNDKLDENEDPFKTLARKLISNIFNGSYSHKSQRIDNLADELKPDAVIHFCHWGCKQVSGGSNILKNDMKEKEIPMLILDGDGIDKRNSHDGQIKTRLEAFLEMIEEDD